MPLGIFEVEVLKVLATNRNPESFVAGGTVLNQAVDSPRTSQDLDFFHDTQEALADAVQRDVATLSQNGFEVDLTRSYATFHRANIQKNTQRTKLEWAFDSAFRFYPTQPDSELGYKLHFWDAATNKVLAGAGRNVIRDYMDLVYLHEEHLSLGALVWAAAAKDVGLSPGFILNELQRLQKYSAADFAELQLRNPVDPVAMKEKWLKALGEAKKLFDQVLNDDAPYGCFFLDKDGHPQTPTPETLPTLRPHFGSVRGCWPRIVEDASIPGFADKNGTQGGTRTRKA